MQYCATFAGHTFVFSATTSTRNDGTRGSKQNNHMEHTMGCVLLSGSDMVTRPRERNHEVGANYVQEHETQRAELSHRIPKKRKMKITRIGRKISQTNQNRRRPWAMTRARRTMRNINRAR